MNLPVNARADSADLAGPWGLFTNLRCLEDDPPQTGLSSKQHYLLERSSLKIFKSLQTTKMQTDKNQLTISIIFTGYTSIILNFIFWLFLRQHLTLWPRQLTAILLPQSTGLTGVHHQAHTSVIV